MYSSNGGYKTGFKYWENLIGKLLIYDALEMDFQKVSLKKKKLNKIEEVKSL